MKSKNARSVVMFLFLSGALAVSLIFCPTSVQAQTRTTPPAQKQPYKIGATLALGGYSAALGVAARNTILMAIDETNKRGGIKGHKLESVIYDNKSDDSTAVLNAMKLVEKDKVDALIVGSASSSSFAVAGTADRFKTPILYICPVAKLYKPVKQFNFSVVPCTDVEEKARARWMKKQGYKKIAMMWLSGTYGEDESQNFLQEAKNFGLTIVSNEQHKGSDTDMSVPLTKSVAAKPDVIWFATYPQQGAVIAKNAKSLGINIPLFGCYGMTSEAWINIISKETAEGWYGAVVSHQLGAETPPWYPTYPLVKRYAESYHKRFGDTITSTGGNAYDSALMIAAGLKETEDEPDLVKRREKLAYSLENMENFFGLNGPYYMSPTNHNGVGEWAISIVRIVNGKMVIQN